MKLLYVCACVMQACACWETRQQCLHRLDGFRCYKTVCWISDVTRECAGYQILQESMLDIRCYKTACWISDVYKRLCCISDIIRRHDGYQML